MEVTFIPVSFAIGGSEGAQGTRTLALNGEQQNEMSEFFAILFKLVRKLIYQTVDIILKNNNLHLTCINF